MIEGHAPEHTNRRQNVREQCPRGNCMADICHTSKILLTPPSLVSLTLALAPLVDRLTFFARIARALASLRQEKIITGRRGISSEVLCCYSYIPVVLPPSAQAESSSTIFHQCTLICAPASAAPESSRNRGLGITGDTSRGTGGPCCGGGPPDQIPLSTQVGLYSYAYWDSTAVSTPPKTHSKRRQLQM